MNILSKILYYIDIINEYLGKIFAFLVIFLMGIILYDTIVRYFFNSPLTWGMDLNRIILLMIVCLGGGYTLLHGGHVNINILVHNFSERRRAFVDLFTYLFVLIFCVTLVKYGGSEAIKAFKIGETSSESSWQYTLWPLLALIPISGILLGLQAIAKWIRDLVIVVTGKNTLESKLVKGRGGLRG
jgi:TRAP-type mannitol/chloroaromatic compound transport system permease small subunit